MIGTDPAVVMRLFLYTHDPDCASSLYEHRLHAYMSFLSALFSLGYMMLLLPRRKQQNRARIRLYLVHQNTQQYIYIYEKC